MSIASPDPIQGWIDAQVKRGAVFVQWDENAERRKQIQDKFKAEARNQNKILRDKRKKLASIIEQLEKQADRRTPEQNLWFGGLRQAIIDYAGTRLWHERDFNWHVEAQCFVRTARLDYFCDHVGLEADWVRKLLRGLR